MNNLMQLVVFCTLLVCAIDAHAYLDPGTGSMLLQVILGGVAAVGVAAKLYWHKLRAAFGMRKKEKSKLETKAEIEEESKDGSS